MGSESISLSFYSSNGKENLHKGGRANLKDVFEELKKMDRPQGLINAVQGIKERTSHRKYL